MNQELIFWPMIALVALTFTVGPLVLIRRIGAAKSGKVGPKDFRYGESDRVPPDAALANRNFINLFELPVLFYAVCLCLYVTRHVTAIDVGLAWTFLAARIGHSIVHLTTNNVLHRMLVYNFGAVILVAIWVRFAISLL